MYQLYAVVTVCTERKFTTVTIYFPW